MTRAIRMATSALRKAPSTATPTTIQKDAGQFLKSTEFISKNSSKSSHFVKDKRINRPEDNDEYIHSIRIKQMAKKGDVDTALQYFESRLESKRMPTTSPVIYRTMIDALGHAGRWQKAQQVASEMRRRGIKPDGRTTASLLNALANNNDLTIRPVDTLTRAMELYQEAASTEQVSIQLFNALLKVISRTASSFSDLTRIFHADQEDPRPDQFTFAILISTAGHLRVPYSQWCEYIERMDVLGVTVDLPLMKAIFGAIRSALELSTNDHPALERLTRWAVTSHTALFATYDRNSIALHYLLLDVYRKLERHEQAIAHYDAFIRPRLSSRNIDLLISRCFLRTLNMAGKHEQVLREFEAFRKFYFWPDTGTVNAVLEAVIRMRKYACAESYLKGYLLCGKLLPDIRTLKLISSCEDDNWASKMLNATKPVIEAHCPHVLQEMQFPSVKRSGTV